LPDYQYESWFGMLAPAATPRPILDKLSRDIARAVQNPDVRERMQKQGSLPVTNAPAQFYAIIKSDTERNVRILRDAGVAAK